MRIAIPSEDERGIESTISQHFGKTAYYTFVDVEGRKIKNVSIVRVPFEGHRPGDLPNFVKEHGGDIVVAFGMGSRAVDFFRELGIEVVLGASGRVAAVVDVLLKENLTVDKNWKEHGDFGEHSH